MRRFRPGSSIALAVAFCSMLAVPPADAKLGNGGSSGSRGSRTFSAPPSTATAPRGGSPFQRTETPGGMQQRPAGVPAPSSRPFGFGSGLAAGLLGAGLIGMLSGHGFLGGLSGLASLFGLLVQAALLAGVVWIVLRVFRSRAAPAFAGGPAGPQVAARSMPAGYGSGSSSATTPVTIGPADYERFERTLVDAQAAYGREDLQSLSRLATPEMMRVFAADIEANRRRGVRNEVGGAQLLQGDLAEAWREGATEYASVAMRFTVVDVTVDRATGRAVDGRRDVPTQSIELWTFRRESGGPWLLSAIQQAG